MEASAGVELCLDALKRIVAALVAMVEMGQLPQQGTAASGLAQKNPALTLPFRLHRAVLKLLLPAESAARRLVIALARGIVVALPPQRPRQARPKPTSIFVRAGVGTGIVLRPGAPVPAHLAHLVPPKAAARPPSFPLLDQFTDPFRRPGHWPSAAYTVPRICVVGHGSVLAEIRRPPSRNDPVDARRLSRRLAVLVAALDDLPGQAIRFARWKARCDQARAAGRIVRTAPLRVGRPPGGRLSRYDPDARRRRNIRDVDEVLAHAHALAYYALHLDTS